MGCFIKIIEMHENSGEQGVFGVLICNTNFMKRAQTVRKEEKMNILTWVVIIVGGGVGIISTLYMVLSIPAVIVWKIYRKIRYRKSLYA